MKSSDKGILSTLGGSFSQTIFLLQFRLYF